jgi:hypothetical protein
MPEGTYKVLLYFPKKKFSINLGSFKFKHLQTNLVEFNLSSQNPPFLSMDDISSFTNYIPASGVRPDSTYVPDTTVIIDKGTEKVIFQLSCQDAIIKNLNLGMKVINPTNFVIKPNISSVKQEYNKLSGYQYFIIDNPTPGRWKVAPKKGFKYNKKFFYTIHVHQKFSESVSKSERKKTKKQKEKSNSKIKSVFNKVIKNDKK